MKELGVLHYFLGIEVSCSSKGYLLSQIKYTDLFYHECLTDNKIVDTPLEANAQYSPSHGLPFSYPTLYRTIIGSLDLSYYDSSTYCVCDVVSKFVTPPVHWDVVDSYYQVYSRN